MRALWVTAESVDPTEVKYWVGATYEAERMKIHRRRASDVYASRRPAEEEGRNIRPCVHIINTSAVCIWGKEIPNSSKAGSLEPYWN